jgi:hypothetical protein
VNVSAMRNSMRLFILFSMGAVDIYANILGDEA